MTREERCASQVKAPRCGGVYRCEFPENHWDTDDKRMWRHRAGCSRHSGCLVSWDDERTLHGEKP